MKRRSLANTAFAIGAVVLGFAAAWDSARCDHAAINTRDFDNTTYRPVR